MSTVDYREQMQKALDLCYQEHKLPEAIEFMNKLVEEAVLTASSDEAHFTFTEPMELELYLHLHPEGKDIVWDHEPPMSELYYVLGNILVEAGEHEKALKALQNGLKANPMDSSLIMEFLNCLQVVGDPDFMHTTEEMFPRMFRKDDLAACYRFLGCGFTDQENYEAAAACYLLSMHYDSDGERSRTQLQYIMSKTGGKLPGTKNEELMALCNKYHIPVSGLREALTIAIACGKRAMDKNPEEAKYYLTIAYEIQSSPEIKAAIDSL